jgi:hypothetical protein
VLDEAASPRGWPHDGVALEDRDADVAHATIVSGASSPAPLTCMATTV